MKTKKTLQKFTDIDKKIKKLFELKQITYEDYKDFSKEDIERFQEITTERFNALKGKELDNLVYQLEPITPTDMKNNLWEVNHSKITNSMSRLIDKSGRMPASSELAEDTGLSRQTIYNHLKEYSTHPLFLEQSEQFRYLTSKVLAMVYRLAINGDVKAAKLYFDAVGNGIGQQSNNTLIQNQNNYIQINGTVLSQETVKRLNAEQLSTIETILKTALPQIAQ